MGTLSTTSNNEYDSEDDIRGLYVVRQLMDNVTSQELRDYQYLRQLIGSDEQLKDYVSYARSQMDNMPDDANYKRIINACIALYFIYYSVDQLSASMRENFYEIFGRDMVKAIETNLINKAASEGKRILENQMVGDDIVFSVDKVIMRDIDRNMRLGQNEFGRVNANSATYYNGIFGKKDKKQDGTPQISDDKDENGDVIYY